MGEDVGGDGGDVLVGEGDVLTRCTARSVWLSLNQEPPIFFHKGPDVGTLVPGTREKNWGWYLVLGMGNKVGTWYSGRKKMGLVPGIRG